MHLVIISGATRPMQKSNTAKIIAAFRKGFEEGGSTAEVWYLSDRRQWQSAREAFANHEQILFALPLYVENIPGIMLEFLEGLPPKAQPGTKMAFLIQGGFPEASQLRCCEAFVQTLPPYFNCEYAGALVKGDMFGVNLMGEKLGSKLVLPFEEMGRSFAKAGCFDEAEAAAFAAPEHLPASTLRKFNLIGRPMQKFFMGRIAKSLGCKKKLDDRPYALR